MSPASHPPTDAVSGVGDAMPPRIRGAVSRVGVIVGVAVAYFAAGRLGLEVAGVGHNVALIWPATGLALAVLLRVGTHAWPGIMLGDLAVAITGHVPLGVAGGIAAGHALGPLAAALTLDRTGFCAGISRPRDALLLAVVVVLFMLIPASVGVSSLVAGGQMPAADAASSWLRWWVGDVVGTMIVAPLILTASRQSFDELRAGRAAEFLLLLATTVACGYAAWTTPSPLPVAFLTLPPLVWAVLRFGVFASSSAAFVLGAFATWATAADIGPLGGIGLQTRLLMLTAYLASVALVQLLMSTVLQSRLAAERELSRERLLLASVVDSVSDGIIAVGADGRILVLNPAAERILGHVESEVLHRPIDAVLPRLVVDSVNRAPDDGIRDGRAGVTSGELEARRADGTLVPLEVSIARVEHEGRILTTALLRDLSERRAADAERVKLEGELRQSQKMEAIGTLAGGVAHDFNNILGAILGNAELLELDLPSGHVGRQSVAQIVRASKRARELVQQILTFSRQREGTRQLVSLEHVTQEVLGLVRTSLPSNVELRVQFDPHCTPVMADPSQLHQVILNLCTNAIHAMRPAGGTLEVRVEPSAPIPGETTERACVLVKDTGVGMSPELRERIFEPFFTTRPTGEGTGLGLSVVHGIIRSHHGAVEVTSDPGTGSEFRVHLPAAGPRMVAPTPASTALMTAGRGERVLFVDDEAALVALGVRALQRLGYAAEGCTKPHDAVATLQERPDDFDLLITDLSMPGMLGTQVIETARALRPGLAVILATGYGGSLADEQLEHLGIQHVLSKPATLLTFARVVRDALDDSRRQMRGVTDRQAS